MIFGLGCPISVSAADVSPFPPNKDGPQMEDIIMLKTFIAAAATGAALIVTPATAGSNSNSQSQAQSVSIDYSDLNLGTARGQAQLERRIESAARKVCKLNVQRTGTRLSSPERKACYSKARQTARSQMATVMNAERRGG